MADKLSPIVHFDFDGTLVNVADKKYSLQNARKYPLIPIPRSDSFIQAIREEGIEVGSIISRRPPLRERVTKISLHEAGLSGYFQDDLLDIRLMGILFPWWKSEARKAAEVAKSAEARITGMIEDKPHKLGKELLDVMVGNGKVYEPLVIGVVSHPEASSRIDVLEESVVAKFGGRVAVHREDEGMQITSHEQGSFTLDVVRLGDLSELAGRAFAQRLLDYTF